MFGRRPFPHVPRVGRRDNRLGGGNNGMLLVLLMQLFAQIQQLERKPPVTLALVGSMVGLFVYKGHPGIPTATKYALCPSVVVKNFDWKRLFVSAFLHVDEWHLYNNMVSLLWKGVHLEFKYGTEKFIQLIAVLLVLSHTLTVLGAYCLSVVLADQSYYRQCSIGFSAVLFALKVVLNQNSPAYTNIMGMNMPTKYAAWFELIYIHLFVPRSSFLGHLAGILAGYLYLKSPEWVLPSRQYRPNRPSYTYSSGRASNNSNSTEGDEELARRLQEEEYRRARS